MKKLIAVLFLTTLSLLFTACNNGSTPEVDKSQKDTTTKNTLSADTVQKTASLSGEIALEQLPSNIKEFISKNYEGYTMQSAAHDPLCSGGDAIDVAITKKGSASFSLIFLPDGTYVQQEEDIDLSKAPNSILEIVKTKYAGYKPAQQIELLTLADKRIQYLLDISKGTTTKEVIFNEDGTVACEH